VPSEDGRKRPKHAGRLPHICVFYMYVCMCIYIYIYIQGVSGGIVNILRGGSMNYSE